MKDEMNREELQDDIEPTGEDNLDEPDLEAMEENIQAKLKKLQAKLKVCEAEKGKHLEELQRTKADFLNARKRLEEEKGRDKERIITQHIEKLLPLCDSFYMAMSNTETWNAIDGEWRKGVESINSQLQRILTSYGVKEVVPNGDFDPNHHEAMAEVPVTDAGLDHTIVSVIQVGYIREVDGQEIIIRPPRVAVGVYTDKN